MEADNTKLKIQLDAASNTGAVGSTSDSAPEPTKAEGLQKERPQLAEIKKLGASWAGVAKQMEEGIEKQVNEDRDSKPGYWHCRRLLGQANKLQRKIGEQQTTVAELKDTLQAEEATLQKLGKDLGEVVQLRHAKKILCSFTENRRTPV